MARLTDLLDERRRTIDQALPYIGVAQEWALRHTERRREAEVRYLTDLVAAVPTVILDERQPRPRKQKPLGKSGSDPKGDTRRR